MKQMLSFNWELLKRKKSWWLLLALANAMYVMLILFVHRSDQWSAQILSMIMASVNTYFVLGVVNNHRTKDHKFQSSYSVCVYFPVKRRNIYLCESIIALLIVLLHSMITLLGLLLNTMFFHTVFTGNAVMPYLLFGYCGVCATASLIIITSISSGAFMLGLILEFTLLCGVAGGMVGIYGEKFEGIPMYHTFILLAGGIALWAISNAITIITSRFVNV